MVDDQSNAPAGRARTRAIRKRMASTGETFVVAARRHDAELNNPEKNPEAGELHGEASHATASDFIAYCQGCGEQVAPDDGMLWIDRRERTAAREAGVAFERALEERVKAHPDDPLAGAFRAADAPRPAQWQTHHYRCSPPQFQHVAASGYTIRLSRLRTYLDLTEVTSHFGAKGVFGDTDWAAVMREMRYAKPAGADEQRRRFRPVHPASS